ncbi:MAG: hypothetical protein AABP62_10670 [Planctomycetota bacterium]
MCKVLVFSTASAKLAAIGASFLCLAMIGCGNATTATPVSAATAIPVVPVVAAAVANEANAASGAAASGDWGTIKGQILAGGPVAPLKLLVAKGDASAKDAAVCAAQDVPDESLVIDAKTGGIANVVVYLQKKPAKVHPNLEKSATPQVVFDQKGCQFLPHVLLVRTDQNVLVLSGDAIAHNTHTYPLKNKQENFIVSPNDRTGVAVPSVNLAERLPAKIGCDIHPWMQAWWVILDHPYAAVTQEDGTFEIKDLPVGDHVFTVWQEKVGYLDKMYKVTVKAGDNDLKPMKVPVENLAK